jgi:hypothetical protein
MKKLLLFTLIFLAQQGWAQTQSSKLDTQWLHQKKYSNGRWSAYAYLLKSTGNGKAACFTPQGKVMFESSISRNHGHHSVTFLHHANGVVSKAETSQAPDAGIQWYKSQIYFNEKGEKIREERQSHDDLERIMLLDPPFEIHPSVPRPNQPFTPTVPPSKPAPTCAVIYSNILVVENLTAFPIQVQFAARQRIKTSIIAPGESRNVDTLIQAQFFQNPIKEGVFQVELTQKRKKWECVSMPAIETKTSDSSTLFTVQILQKKKINPKSRPARTNAPSPSI